MPAPPQRRPPTIQPLPVAAPRLQAPELPAAPAVQPEPPVAMPTPAPRAARALDATPMALPQMPSPSLPAPVAVQAEPAPVAVPAAPLRAAPAVLAPAAVAAPSADSSAAATATPSFDVAAPAGAVSPLETPRSGLGTPQAGARLGHDVATAPSLPASAPRLNLELPRARGGEISSRGSMGLLQLLPRPPETKSKLSQDIEKAAKPDCRSAYAGLGLLAAIPLAVDAARDKGCKW
jgi:hypothetical protein